MRRQIDDRLPMRDHDLWFARSVVGCLLINIMKQMEMEKRPVRWGELSEVILAQFEPEYVQSETSWRILTSLTRGSAISFDELADTMDTNWYSMRRCFIRGCN
jgi:hypothetical protein